MIKMDEQDVTVSKRSFGSPDEAIKKLMVLIERSVMKGATGFRVEMDGMYFEYTEWVK